jgi:hypothetical protein
MDGYTVILDAPVRGHIGDHDGALYCLLSVLWWGILCGRGAILYRATELERLQVLVRVSVQAWRQTST